MKKQQSIFFSRMLFIWTLSVFLVFGVSWNAFAQSSNINQESDSDIRFKVKSFGIYVNGEFTEFEITVNLDTLSIVESHIKARISVGSISTGITKRDEHLKTDKFFNLEEQPFILFESKDIKRVDKGSFLAKGTLVMKGIEKSISIPFYIEEVAGSMVLISEFELNRLDYKVGSKNWTMGDIVKIAVSYKFKN